MDTRVLRAIYAPDQIDPAVYVGQQVDVFIDAGLQARRAGSSPRYPSDTPSG